MLAAEISTSDIIALFAGAGLVLYVAARAAVDAVTSATDPAPGRMALAHWMPVAWAAIVATLAGRSEIGVGLALATSVAAMGLVLGVLLCIAPEGEFAHPHASAWPFVMPASILILVAGFSGALTWWHALMLLGLGASVWLVWISPLRIDPLPLAASPNGPRAHPPGGGFAMTEIHPLTASSPAEATPQMDPPTPPATSRYWLAQLLLAIALGAIGGWIGYKAVTIADDRTRVATSGLISLAVLSPLLVLSMLGTGATAVHHGRLGSALATVVGVILLNLCLLLPLVVLTHYARIVGVAWADGARTMEDLSEVIRPMPFPLPVWRLDTVLLMVLGLMLIPVSLGRWKLGKAEGVALAFVYASYLVASTALAIRM